MSGLLRRLGSVLGKWKGTALRPPTQHTASTQPSVPKPMESPTVLPLTLNPAPQMPQTLNPMPTATPSSSSAVSAEVASSQAAVEAQPPSLKMLNRHDRKNAQRKATSLPKSSVLRRKLKPISLEELSTHEVQRMLDHLVATIGVYKQSHYPIVSIAAPQLGYELPAFAWNEYTELRDSVHGIPDPSCFPVDAESGKLKTPQVIVNPEVLSVSSTMEMGVESCISLPGFGAVLRRPSKVNVRFWDRNGGRVEREFAGFQCRLFLHEIQHLHGILYTDFPECERFFEQEVVSIKLPFPLPPVVTVDAEVENAEEVRRKKEENVARPL